MLDIEKFADTGQLFDNHYKLIRPLNTEGGTADVWLALDVTTVGDKNALDKALFLDDESLSALGLLVAIKIYKPKNALDIEGERRFREEFVIVFNCHHANLIHPVYFSIFEETPYLVLPYCRRGSSELLVGSFDNDSDIWRYIHDVAAGLRYLHRCDPPIIHQDIKPANVLIDDNGNYAITDFGISAKRMKLYGNRSGNDDFEEQSGTFAYMAPERFAEGNIPSAMSDIWAVGATLCELLTGRVPFGENGGLAQPDGKVTLPFKNVKASGDIKRLICACLSKDPAKRPTAEQLLEAASRQRFKPAGKSRPWGKIAGTACALAAVGAAVWAFMPSKDDGTTVEQRFDDALAWVNASTPDSVRTGLEKLDSLANLNYVPAQQALNKAVGSTSMVAENARAALSRARQSYAQADITKLTDGIAVELLTGYDKAIEWAALSRDSALIDECKHQHDSFVNDLLRRYDDQIEWGRADNPQVEREFTQYKKAFLEVVNNRQQ